MTKTDRDETSRLVSSVEMNSFAVNFSRATDIEPTAIETAAEVIGFLYSEFTGQSNTLRGPEYEVGNRAYFLIERKVGTPDLELKNPTPGKSSSFIFQVSNAGYCDDFRGFLDYMRQHTGEE